MTTGVLSAIAGIHSEFTAGELLGITSVEALARADADTLYLRLQTLTGSDQDPCVWDTFAAAIHQARTGEATRWWDWTPVRKERQAAGQFQRRPADAQ